MTANQAMASLRLPSLDSVEWVSCPSCLYEWTNLKACQFWPIDGGRPDISHICVRCAEGVGAFPWVMQYWPWKDQVAYNVKRFNGFYRLPIEDLSPSSFRAFLEYKEKTFMVTTRIGSAPIAVTYNGVTENFDNSIAAWMHIKKKLDQKEDAPVKGEW